MKFRFDCLLKTPRFAMTLALVALAGCQSGERGGFLGIGGAKDAPAEPKVEQVDLSAYCPRITLREGTAYYNNYAKAPPGEPQQDRSLIIYQASIGDATRSCRYDGGQLYLNVALAGRVVPGPKGEPGTVTLPIRVAVLRGDEVLYSELHKYPVNIATLGATQFVFSDPDVVIPAPTARNIQILAGFDEGPYDTP